jgi:hypothetical protein
MPLQPLGHCFCPTGGLLAFLSPPFRARWLSLMRHKLVLPLVLRVCPTPSCTRHCTRGVGHTRQGRPFPSCQRFTARGSRFIGCRRGVGQSSLP